MSWVKGILLFCAVYGVMWLRQDLRSVHPSADHDLGKTPYLGEAESLKDNVILKNSKNDDPSQKQSLSYAFKKLSSEPTRAISSTPVNSVLEKDTDSHNALNLEKILDLKENPEALIVEADQQLQQLDHEALPERIILLREVLSARNADTMYQVEALFAKERDWFAQEASRMEDQDSLASYIGELTRLSLMGDAGQVTPLSMLQSMTESLANNPAGLQILQKSIQQNIPWEYQKWFQDQPPNIQNTINPNQIHQ